MELITDLGPILAIVPAIIIKITSDLKGLKGVPKEITFLIPYLVSILLMVGLWVIFNEQPIGVYIVNGVIFAYGAVAGYEFSKPKTVKEKIAEQNGKTYNEPSLVPQD